MSDPVQERRARLAEGLDGVRARVAAACDESGRDVASVELVVVTKFFPASDILLLAELGVRQIGESRDQEARAKREELGDMELGDMAELGAMAELDHLSGLTWHFIGQLQTNKVSAVVSYADVVQTADRPKLVRALASAAGRQGRQTRVLVQVDLDPGAATRDSGGRGGAPADVAVELADLVAESAPLVLGGVMAVAPADGDGADPDEAFGRLAEVAARIRASHPDAGWVSAGMSSDLEAAVRHGATHLRVGSAILGSRPAFR